MKRILLLLLITILSFSMFSCNITPDNPDPGIEGEVENTSPESNSEPAESGDKTIEGEVTEPESETEFVRPESYEYIQRSYGKGSFVYLTVNGEPVGTPLIALQWSTHWYEAGTDGKLYMVEFSPAFEDPDTLDPSYMAEITYRPEEAEEVVKVECLKGEVTKDCYYVFGKSKYEQEPLTLDDLVPGNTYCRYIIVRYPEPEGGATEPGYYGEILFCYAVNIV